MSSRSTKTKSDKRGVVVVQKQRANAYTMMLLVSFTALCIACFCMYRLMDNYYAMKTKPDPADKAQPLKPRDAIVPAAGAEAPAGDTPAAPPAAPAAVSPAVDPAAPPAAAPPAAAPPVVVPPVVAPPAAPAVDPAAPAEVAPPAAPPAVVPPAEMPPAAGAPPADPQPAGA